MKTVELKYQLSNSNYILTAVKPDGEPWREPKRKADSVTVTSTMRDHGWILIGKNVWKLPENDKDRLELLLTLHDWTFPMSDDGGVYRSGEREVAEIRKVARKVDGAAEMIQRYIEKFDGGTFSLSSYL